MKVDLITAAWVCRADRARCLLANPRSAFYERPTRESHIDRGVPPRMQNNTAWSPRDNCSEIVFFILFFLKFILMFFKYYYSFDVSILAGCP